jgi:uncharacterized protein YndB with AHSA1/START domain
MPEAVTAREITITRVYDAPRELVWKAWTEPEQLAKWWGKRGWNTPLSSLTMDVRPGGAFRWSSIAEEDGAEMSSESVYREVVEPERLVFERSGGADDGAPTIVTFADLGDGRTEMVFHTTVHMTDATRARAAAGLASAFDRLAEQLA